MKKILSLILALVMLSVLVACRPNSDEDISGVAFDLPEYNTDTFSRYENKHYGIIIEYPEKLQRLGNFELDGYICFEVDDISLKVYIPDTETETIMSVEEYTNRFMKFGKTDESENIKYGKTTGYKSVIRKDGNLTVEFIVKGVDGFYRFSYTCLEETWEDNKKSFEEIFSSIRIDDGIYSKLNRMAIRYKELLEYATSLQYVTDANYANHCLNNFNITGSPQDKEEALQTWKSIKSELSLIANYEREEGEQYGEYWDKIIVEAESMIAVCDDAIATIERGDIAAAQRISLTAVSYELSEVSAKFLSIINAEIAEY